MIMSQNPHPHCAKSDEAFRGDMEMEYNSVAARAHTRARTQIILQNVENNDLR